MVIKLQHLAFSASSFPRMEKECRNMHLTMRVIIRSSALDIHFAKFSYDLPSRCGFWRFAKKKNTELWRGN